MPPPPPGRMSASDFVFEKQLGTGAFSRVVVGLYKPTGEHYAVKLISKRTILNAPTDEERKRMAEVARRETRMLLMCDHPNIVKFYASMQTPEDLVYVTELCDGGELLDMIARRGKIPLEASRHAIAELFSAVLYLHNGEKRNQSAAPGSPPKVTTIIHRDIKPENIMITSKRHVKLIDFGTAVVCESVHDRPEAEGTSKGRAQTFCGTTYYMSPELLEDNYTCCASDFWGCGCVLYHMLVGTRPFDAATQYLLIKAILEQEPEYPDDLDPDAKDLIQKLLVKSPDRRLSGEEVKRHPFFSTIDFNTVSSEELADLWIRETPWSDASKVAACTTCGKAFTWACPKDYCRWCGKIKCSACLPSLRGIPESRYSTPQHVCAECCKALGQEAAG